MSLRTQLFILVFIICLVASVSGFSWLGYGNTGNIEEDQVLNKSVDNIGGLEEARKKKKGKFLFTFLVALFIIKGVLIPFAFKAMAVMSSVSVTLSLMSLIISSLIGYSRAAWRHLAPTIKIIQAKDPWSRDEGLVKGYSGGLDYWGDSGNLEQVLATEDLEHHHHYYQK